MLLLRPNCECCDKDLGAADEGAMVCSFECTFCSICAVQVLELTCPNCGGQLCKRPPRRGVALERFPASTERRKLQAKCSERPKQEKVDSNPKRGLAFAVQGVRLLEIGEDRTHLAVSLTTPEDEILFVLPKGVVVNLGSALLEQAAQMIPIKLSS